MSDQSLPPAALPVTLHVCVSCRAGQDVAPHTPRPGRLLFDRLRETAPETLHVRPVECLARCDAGCTAAIAAEGRWTFLLGHLSVDEADDLLIFAARYRASRTGMVMPSKRPASLADVLLGRLPAILHAEGLNR